MPDFPAKGRFGTKSGGSSNTCSRQRAVIQRRRYARRSEHRVVVSGMAKVANAEKETFLRPYESTYIRPASRLSNPDAIDWVMIEVQTGDYVGEDDIVRLRGSLRPAIGRRVSPEAL